MKSVTIREAQHDLPRLLREVESGNAIEIRRRKEPVARLAPVAPTDAAASWSDQRRRLRSLWGETGVDVLDETLSDLGSED